MGHIENALSALASLVPSWLSHKPPLQTVAHLDLRRYAGRWYEIATLPIFAERDSTATTATYRLLDNGEVEVVNRCRDKHGVLQEIVGRAWMPDVRDPGKLKVSFYWPVRADYWILALGKEYEYAMVGHPSRHYLWILSRTSTLAPDMYRHLLDLARDAGYDLSKLRKTEQPSHA